MTAQRIETIKTACLKVYGNSCLNAKPTKATLTKSEKALLKLIDSVEKSEYCKASANSEKLDELDFND